MYVLIYISDIHTQLLHIHENLMKAEKKFPASATLELCRVTVVRVALLN